MISSPSVGGQRVEGKASAEARRRKRHWNEEYESAISRFSVFFVVFLPLPACTGLPLV
jgi:hypothetical protein